jgi:plastocyanin
MAHNNMNKLLVTLIVLLFVGVGAFFLLSGSEKVGSASEGNDNNGVKTFVMTGENFKFVMGGLDNPDIRVKKGDIVRIEFTSTQGFHDWVVDEFDAATIQIRDTDESTFVEFVADQTGTFEYYCSVGQHRANGMKGNLIVE